MPYSGASDAKLPNHVKKLPVKQRRQWVHVWDSTYKGCQAKDGEDCEGTAARAANGVVKEYFGQILGVSDKEVLDRMFDEMLKEDMNETEEATKDVSEKHYDEVGYMYIPSNIVTFAEAKDYIEARKKQAEISSLNSMFSELCSNVFYNSEMEMGDKASAVANLAKELASMVEDTGAKSLGDRINEIFTGKKEPNLDDSFFVFKDTQDNLRWVAIYTNNYYDKEQEAFPVVRHREFVEYVDRTKDFPELWLWHTPGSRWGEADFIDLTDEGFVVASGTVDAGKEDIAASLKERQDHGEAIKLSHGFRFDPNGYNIKERTYGPYWTFEISPLPGNRAANEGTAFYLGRDGYMPFTKEKRDWLVGLVGEQKVSSYETNISEMNKELQAKGVNFKGEVEPIEVAKKDDGDVAAQVTTPPEPAPAAQIENQTATTVPNLVEQLSSMLDQKLDARFGEFSKSFKDYQDKTDAQIVQLSKSEDQKIEDRFRQPNPTAVAEKASSESGSNELTPEEAKSLRELFTPEDLKHPAAPFAQDMLRVLNGGGGIGA